MSGPLFVKVDWNKSGSFTDSQDDVTDRVRGSVSASFGRDQVTALSPVVAGRGAFTLDNRSKAYSPRNAASPLFGNLKPNRPVLITRVVGGTTYTIFRGHTDDSPINPDLESKTVAFSVVDGLADFRGINVTVPLYQGIRTGQAIGYVLDAAGWTGTRDIDVGATIIPWFWTDGADAFTILQDLLSSESEPALMSIDTNGGFVFRDRHHRLIRSASLTSQATFRGTGVTEPVMSKGFTYSDNWQNIVNAVAISVDERAPQSALSVVFSSDETISIAASSSVTILARTSDPFRDAVTPVVNRDYIVVTGGVSSVVLSNTSGTVTSITITATGAGASVTNLQLRGRSVPVVRSYQVTSTDSTSITDFGQRSLPDDPVWAGRLDAQAIGDLTVLQRKQSLPLLTVRFSCQATQVTRLAKLLSLDISDRVTVIETETALNGDFFVESIEHTISSQYEHEIIFGLEAVPSSPTSIFILDTSLLNGATPLGY
jgi:hypothetical protein